MPGAFKSWNRKCVHTLNILALITLQKPLTKIFHFPLIKFPSGLMSECVQSVVTHTPSTLSLWAALKGTHIHMLNYVRSVALTSASAPLSPVSDIIHSSSLGLTSSTQTHEVCLCRTQSLPIIHILLDGPLCRWISAFLTHSSSVWAPPPLNLLPLFVSLVVSFSSPCWPVFVLIIAEWCGHGEVWVIRGDSGHSSLLGPQ